jgi:hypothetical protein
MPLGGATPHPLSNPGIETFRPTYARPARGGSRSEQRTLRRDADPARKPIRAQALLLDGHEPQRMLVRTEVPHAELCQADPGPTVPHRLCRRLGHHEDTPNLEQRSGALCHDGRRAEGSGRRRLIGTSVFGVTRDRFGPGQLYGHSVLKVQPPDSLLEKIGAPGMGLDHRDADVWPEPANYEGRKATAGP